MFFRRPQYFPKQLFFRFLRQQLLVLIPSLFLAAWLIEAYVRRHLSGQSSAEEVIAAYDRAFILLASIMGLAITALSVRTGYRLVLPLGRMLVKARSILRRDEAGSREEEAEDESEGEWSDLESALHRIGKDMRKKDLSLSREREETEAILGAIAEAVVAVDRQGNLLFYNSQFALLFDDIHRRQTRLSDFFRSPDVLGAFRRTLKEGAAFSLSTRLRLKGDSAPRHFSLSVAPLRASASAGAGTETGGGTSPRRAPAASSSTRSSATRIA
jgi:PAS domain-containing protein